MGIFYYKEIPLSRRGKIAGFMCSSCVMVIGVGLLAVFGACQ
jgi:hypothetical protein